MDRRAAHRIALAAHEGQLDTVGRPFVHHVERVTARVIEVGADELAVIGALLHDVVEKADVTLDDLRAAGASEELVALVDALTMRPEEDEAAYLVRVVDQPRAIVIKRADLFDKMTGFNAQADPAGKALAEERLVLLERLLARRAS